MIPNHLFVTILNRIFDKACQNGELDFLIDKVLLIQIQDAHLTLGFSLVDSKLVACPERGQSDLRIRGTTYDFLLLATQREDPDSLFFNRHLQLEGSTELGLYVKNFLASVELDSMAQLWVKQLDCLLNGYELSWQLRQKFPFHR